MSWEWYVILLVATSGASFIFGRWRGIKEFEAEMVKTGYLPPT